VTAFDRHIIHTVKLELSTDLKQVFHHDLQSRAGHVLREYLPGALEPLFSEFSDSRHIVFERLDVSLGRLPAERFEKELLVKLKREITSLIQTAEAGSTPDARILSEKGFRYERMIHFLASGALPWYASESDRTTTSGPVSDGPASEADGSSYDAGQSVDFARELAWLLREMPDKVRAFLRSRRNDRNTMDRALSLFEPRPEELFTLLMPGQQQASGFYSRIRENTDAATLTDLNITYLQALLAAGAGKPFWMSVLAFFLQLDRDGHPPPVRLISELFNRARPGKRGRHGRKQVLSMKDLEKISEALNSIRTADRQRLQQDLDTPPSSATLADLFRNTSITDQTGKKRTAPSSNIKEPGRGHMTGKTDREDVDELVRNIRSGRTLDPESESRLYDDGPADKSMGTSADMVIRNAGLVLLWPFLARFFDTLELAAGGSFVDEVSRMKAMQLLGYLESGDEQIPEYRLVLIKLLCGYPATRSPERPLPLSDREKREADILLESVITHWKVLKNTSIQGFRQSFLQRNGLLRQADHSWKLYVDRTSYDILLDKLPWSYSIVKLPWMEHALTVEW